MDKRNGGRTAHSTLISIRVNERKNSHPGTYSVTRGARKLFWRCRGYYSLHAETSALRLVDSRLSRENASPAIASALAKISLLVKPFRSALYRTAWTATGERRIQNKEDKKSHHIALAPRARLSGRGLRSRVSCAPRTRLDLLVPCVTAELPVEPHVSR